MDAPVKRTTKFTFTTYEATNGNESKQKEPDPHPVAITVPSSTVSAICNSEKLNAVVVVGGYTSQNISVSDIYFLLLESWHWKMFRSLESFPKRHHFSLVAMGDSELLIFGGLSRPAEGVLGDLWQIDLGSCMFTPEHESQRVVLR